MVTSKAIRLIMASGDSLVISAVEEYCVYCKLVTPKISDFSLSLRHRKL